MLVKFCCLSTDAELRESGLFVESQDGQLFDRFRDRLMFPLGDESGYTVGFSGRRISNDNFTNFSCEQNMLVKFCCLSIHLL